MKERLDYEAPSVQDLESVLTVKGQTISDEQEGSYQGGTQKPGEDVPEP